MRLTGVSDVISIVIAIFVVVVFVILLPLSVIVGTLRRWFWLRVVAGAWARVEQAKNRELAAEQERRSAKERVDEAYRALRDALLEDANKGGAGIFNYNRWDNLTRISQAAAALEDEVPDLKPHVDEILQRAKPNSFFSVDTARQWLEPIASRIRRMT
jgi:hypothetical protein